MHIVVQSYLRRRVRGKGKRDYRALEKMSYVAMIPFKFGVKDD